MTQLELVLVLYNNIAYENIVLDKPHELCKRKEIKSKGKECLAIV